MGEGRFAALVGSAGALASSLEALVAGDFPDELKEKLHSRSGGLFLSKSEIDFGCSCPDSARLCKHIAGGLTDLFGVL